MSGRGRGVGAAVFRDLGTTGALLFVLWQGLQRVDAGLSQLRSEVQQYSAALEAEKVESARLSARVDAMEKTCGPAAPR